MASIATLKRLSPKALSEKILAERDASDPSWAVVDVRDDDYIGGHIKGCIHIPSVQIDAMLPTLLRRLQDKKTVVFHCALSQQRGPSAALKYVREKGESNNEQEVYVLDKGFTGWQEEFGEDERLTEGYRKELWQDY
ncbi:hypothetical protein Golomagni_05617 [Golovinomyces magnicellulatus]|nr:hypothetical protein Golomagni_05617 [Golovinomyces magnicellulatus]